MDSSHPADSCSRLLPRQRSLVRWLRPLWAACELAARALGRTSPPTPRDNTKRCYETLFDPLCGATGVWPDYTEGYFPRGDETYDEAKLGQFDYILDHTGCGPGTRLLDLGCGNGKLLARAAARGCIGTGITISSSQAESCRAQGLDVRQCSYHEARHRLEAGSFDVVVLNGPTEHFVSAEDARDGRSEAIRRELFELVAHLLAPGGRVFITCIHFRHPTDPAMVLLGPMRHRVGSYYFYCANLVAIYSGWYPDEGEYQRIATDLGFSVALERDATRDYYLTSQHWSQRLQAHLREHPDFARRFLVRFFLADPRYFFQAFLFWFYDPWTWQFRGGDDSPMVHRWLMFEAPDTCWSP